MGRGRRITTMGDDWTKIILSQPRPEPIQPAQHLSATWCAHGWACRACAGPGEARPGGGVMVNLPSGHDHTCSECGTEFLCPMAEQCDHDESQFCPACLRKEL